MSKLYAIIAYENFFGGLHGIKDTIVVECEDYSEACEIGADMSYNLIEEYRIADEAGWTIEYGDDPEAYEEKIEDDIAFDVYEIKDNVVESIEFLNEKLYNNEEEFLREYCKNY